MKLLIDGFEIFAKPEESLLDLIKRLDMDSPRLSQRPLAAKIAGEVFNLKTKTTEKLVETSKLSAKIDNSCIQDGYTLYQHNFFVTDKGD